MNISYMLLPFAVFFILDYFFNWMGNFITVSPERYYPNSKRQYSANIRHTNGGLLHHLLFAGQKNSACLWYVIGQVCNYALLIFYIVICLFFAPFAESRYKILFGIHLAKIMIIFVLAFIDHLISTKEKRKTMYIDRF